MSAAAPASAAKAPPANQGLPPPSPISPPAQLAKGPPPPLKTPPSPSLGPLPHPDSPVMSKTLSFKVREKAAADPRSSTRSMGSESSVKSSSSTSPRGDGPPLSPRSLAARAIKANTDPNKRFTGRWESATVDGLDAYLAELGLSSKFKRLSDRFASLGSVLTIEQEGDLFSIEDSNDMRDMMLVFVIGTPFESESEKGEEVICNCSWDGPVLTLVSTPKAEGGNVVMIRRVIENDTLIQTSQVVGSSSIAKRVFYRTR